MSLHQLGGKHSLGRFSLIILLLALLFPWSPYAPVQAVSRLEQNMVESPVIPILAYHNIGPVALSEWYVTMEQFSRQLDMLQAYGYTSISLQDLLEYRNGSGTLPDRPVIITFDDGFQGVYDYAYPALRSRGMTATFFIITDFTAENAAGRSTNESWKSSSEPVSYHLIWPEIQEMAQAGFDIGSHTREHPNLSSLYVSDPDGVRAQLVGSKEAIEAHLGEGAARFFAYPYGAGAGNPEIEQLVAEAGYLAAVRFGPDDGPADPLADDLYALPRPAVYAGHTLDPNPANPWWFFPRRVDPKFPVPNIYNPSFSAVDAAGKARTQFYPGEPLAITVTAANGGQAANIVGRLSLFRGEETVYDSHFEGGPADVRLAPFPGEGSRSSFSYTWDIPTGPEAIGSYRYRFQASDETGLIQYYQSSVLPAFDVIAKPIGVTVSPSTIPGIPGVERTLTFTVWTDDPASEAYLVVSLSSHLEVVRASAPRGTWRRLEPGSCIKKRGEGHCVPSSYLSYELYDANFGAGRRQYELNVRSLPGFSAEDWIMYRLAMKMNDAIPTGETYLRDPLSGESDQSNYFAWKILPESEIGSQVFLPVIVR